MFRHIKSNFPSFQSVVPLRVAVLWILCVLLGDAVAGSRLVTKLDAGEKQTVVTYGTSLTAGGAWVGQVREALSKKYPGRLTVINSGQGSMWSKWGVDNLEQRVISRQPDTVFIEFAINDAFLTYKTSVEDARGNLLRMIDGILAAKADTEIILMTMNPPTGVHLERRPKIADYVQMYREVAKQRNLQLIDHYPNWERILKEDEKQFMAYVPDGIHPGAEGYRQVVTPLILRELGLSAP
jgi:lysophospholipase L1-like esterase